MGAGSCGCWSTRRRRSKCSAPVPKVPLPSDQTRFMSAIVEARSQFTSAPNELAAGGIRNTRQQAICNAVGGQNASGWIGKVSYLSTNGDGRGVITLELGSGLHVSTWNNAISDYSDKSTRMTRSRSQAQVTHGNCLIQINRCHVREPTVRHMARYDLEICHDPWLWRLAPSASSFAT
jgi:hypothetical protein